MFGTQMTNDEARMTNDGGMLVRRLRYDFEVGVFEADAAAGEADDADAGGAEAVDELIDVGLIGHARDDAKVGIRKWLPGGDGKGAEGLADDRLGAGKIEVQLERFV